MMICLVWSRKSAIRIFLFLVVIGMGTSAETLLVSMVSMVDMGLVSIIQRA